MVDMSRMKDLQVYVLCTWLLGPGSCNGWLEFMLLAELQLVLISIHEKPRV